MVNILTVDIDGEVFNTFKSVSIQKDLDFFGFQFDITINVPMEKESSFLNSIVSIFKEEKPDFDTQGSFIKIKIDGEAILTGYIEKQRVSYSSDNASISIQGRDKLCDFVDSRISNQIFKTPVSFVDIVQKVLTKTGYIVVMPDKSLLGMGLSKLDSLGLDKLGLATKLLGNQVKIINDYEDSNFFFTNPIPDFLTNENIGFSKDEGAYDFIKRLANKRKLVIGTDNSGNFIIRSIGDTSSKTILVNNTFANKPNPNNNIKSAEIVRDDSQRYYEYKILSSGTNTAPTQTGTINGEAKLPTRDSLKDNTAQYFGVCYDNSIRKTRKFLDNVTGMNNSQCKERAEWECNIRLAKSFQYKCSVYGWRQNLNPIILLNPLWDINQIVTVNDSRAGLINTNMLIKSINYKQDTSSGTITEMTLINKLAYTDSVFEPRIKQGKKKKKSLNPILDPAK